MKGKLILEDGSVFNGELLNEACATGEVVFNTGMKETAWTKGDIFSYLNVYDNPEYLNHGQVAGGIVFLKKCANSYAFVNQWYYISHNHYPLITDSPSIVPNFPDFREKFSRFFGRFFRFFARRFYDFFRQLSHKRLVDRFTNFHVFVDRERFFRDRIRIKIARIRPRILAKARTSFGVFLEPFERARERFSVDIVRQNRVFAAQFFRVIFVGFSRPFA